MIDKLEYFKDPNFVFDPVPHTYVYNNPDTNRPVQIFESVSGFIGQFKKPFDADRIAGYVAKSKKVSKIDVLDEWEYLAQRGMHVGTIVHEWIEDYYHGKDPSIPTISSHPHEVHEQHSYGLKPVQSDIEDRIEKFKKIHEDRLYKLSPIAQELRLFSRKWGLAGTLDILFELNGDFYVGDWKTNKDFKDDDHPKGRRQKLLYPFNDLYDNNLNMYSIQVSMYRLMLEECGFKTKGGFLVAIGPGKPKIYKTLDLRDRLHEFIKKNNIGI